MPFKVMSENDVSQLGGRRRGKPTNTSTGGIRTDYMEAGLNDLEAEGWTLRHVWHGVDSGPAGGGGVGREQTYFLFHREPVSAQQPVSEARERQERAPEPEKQPQPEDSPAPWGLTTPEAPRYDAPPSPQTAAPVDPGLFKRKGFFDR